HPPAPPSPRTIATPSPYTTLCRSNRYRSAARYRLGRGLMKPCFRPRLTPCLLHEINRLFGLAGSWARFTVAALIQRLLHGANRSDRKSTRLNSSHVKISYAVFCVK